MHRVQLTLNRVKFYAVSWYSRGHHGSTSEQDIPGALLDVRKPESFVLQIASNDYTLLHSS